MKQRYFAWKLRTLTLRGKATTVADGCALVADGRVANGSRADGVAPAVADGRVDEDDGRVAREGVSEDFLKAYGSSNLA